LYVLDESVERKAGVAMPESQLLPAEVTFRAAVADGPLPDFHPALKEHVLPGVGNCCRCSERE
jgi:hypothetical protein